MPEITCVGCGRSHSVVYQGISISGGWYNTAGGIRGVLLCTASTDGRDRAGNPIRCGTKTVFEITGNSVTFAPGKLFQEDLKGISQNVRGLFEDALNAFYGQAYRATLGMCRSAIEQALDEKNVKGGDLDTKIRNCPDSIMGNQEKTWADAARLNGRAALHRLMNVTPSQALAALNITITLVNHIASKEPLPASQSGTGSNVP